MNNTDTRRQMPKKTEATSNADADAADAGPFFSHTCVYIIMRYKYGIFHQRLPPLKRWMPYYYPTRISRLMQAMLFRNFFNFLFSGLIIPFRFCRRSFYLFSFVFSLSGASLLLTLPRLFFFSIISTRTCVRKKDLRLPRLRLKYSPVPSPLFYPSFLHFSALTLDFISYICPMKLRK